MSKCVYIFMGHSVYKMQRLEVSGAVRPLYGSLGVNGLSDVKQTAQLVTQQKFQTRYQNGMKASEFS